jgi:hypothetical protein
MKMGDDERLAMFVKARAGSGLSLDVLSWLSQDLDDPAFKVFINNATALSCNDVPNSP